MVLYFSGTGNSKYIAKQIADGLSDKVVSINEKLKNNDTSEIEVRGRLIFVVPTYAWRIPKAVHNWIMQTDFIGVEKVWFVMNCGSEIGNSAKYNEKLCEKKGFAYMGTAQVVMPENYILMFNSPSENEIEEIFEKAQPIIETVTRNIAENKAFSIPKTTLQDKLMSSVVNILFYPMFVKSKAFYADEKCTGCGVCEKVCPLNNIKIKDGKPLWSNSCTHCTSCISYCPAGAIEYGKKTIGKARYKCEKNS